jgi:hypothetical protein
VAFPMAIMDRDCCQALLPEAIFPSSSADGITGARWKCR